MMKVQVQHLINIIGQADYADLIEFGGADHPMYGGIHLVETDGEQITIRCSYRLLELSLEHGIAPATKLFCVGEGEWGAIGYQINAGMIFASTNGDGDIWTKDGYVLTGSDIKLIRRTYEKQLPLDYANDKGLYVW